MKYIISESQYKMIHEDLDRSVLWVKRRANHDTMNDYIDRALGDEPNPCEVYDSEDNFAYAMIDSAVSYFLSTNEDFFHSEYYDEYYRALFNKCKEWYFDSLLEDYRMTCSEEQ